MIACNKPILLLKEKRLRTLPSDIVGQLYKEFDSYSIESSVANQVHNWLRDVGIAKSSSERLILFVSYGGTCRCAMAKVILENILSKRNMPYRLRVMSVAYTFGGLDSASHGARRSVYKAYGYDLLQEHKVTHKNTGLSKDADLILVMSDNYKVGFPENKTYNFKEFFGSCNDEITNPWPDDDTEECQDRYDSCLNQLRSILEKGVSNILEYLDAE
ncbi:MAG: hypothetical protein QQN41_10130 [Nitrosopumilus sp.]